MKAPKEITVQPPRPAGPKGVPTMTAIEARRVGLNPTTPPGGDKIPHYWQ